ncbi:MAG TPA: SCP2 sterol-binding domain-containing protein [Anaerolineales bacterium]|nr:SCP2 sterol-binding domain-containing protein [Anaerolineales bacterium]
MAEELTIAKLMDLMPKAFLPDKAAGVDADIQYHLTGEQGGDWVVTIRDGACKTAQGTVENPKLTLTADASDYIAIISGKLNAMAAFSEGRIKLKGDLALAMKLMNFFKLPA